MTIQPAVAFAVPRPSVLLLCGALFLADGAAPRAEAVSTPAPVEEIAPGVFVRQGVHELMTPQNGGAIANVGFVIGDEAVAVIDSGGSHGDGLRLRAAIRARTPLPIRYVINTHVHPDHVFGNSAFEADAPQFVGHRNLERAMRARGAHALSANRRLLGDDAFAGTTIVLPTVAVEGSRSLDLGGRRLLLTAYPTAHTDADLTVLDEASGILWTGDLLFVGHIPVVDGSLKGWLRVIDTLVEVPAARAVPGHGPAAVAWPGALAPQRAYLTGLADELRALIAAGQGMRLAAERAAQSQRQHWALFDEFNPRNATAGFAELEWE